MRPVVVIPTRNEEKNLPNVLADIRNQTVDTDVVVVDGLSEDSTVKIAEDFGAKVVSLKSSVGWARHIGTLHAFSEYVLHTDADARLPTSWVERHINHLEDYYIVTGPMLYKDDTPLSLINPLYVVGQNIVMKSNITCAAANLSFRKSKYVGFRDIGYAEDMDFLIRMVLKWGEDYHYHDDTLFVYNNHYPLEWWKRELMMMNAVMERNK